MEATEIRYTHLDVETLPELTAVQRVIIKRALPVLNTEDVEKYKAEKEEKANRKYLNRARVRIGFGISLMVLGPIWALALLVAGYNMAALTCFVWVTIVCGMSLLASGIERKLQYSRSSYRWMWVYRCFLGDESIYPFGMGGELPIPSAIRQLARQLTEDLGFEDSTLVSIEYFQYDPFLFITDAQDGDKVYYIAVWDEKGFVLP